MRIAVVILALAGLAGPANAACFDGLGSSGCTDGEVFPRSDLAGLSCQNLWFVRNSIYNENGLCFKTRAAQAEFDNSDCYVDDPAQVKLNNYERENVKRIREAEKRRGCTP